MDSRQFTQDVVDLVQTGWGFRNLLLEKGGVTPEIVIFEELLHTLEQYLAEFNDLLEPSLKQL